MIKNIKTNSMIRANKEKLVIENFSSVLKKLDSTFLVEVSTPHLEEKNARLVPKLEEFKSVLGDMFVELPYDNTENNAFGQKSTTALEEIGNGSDKVYGVVGRKDGLVVLLNVFTSPENEELIRTKLATNNKNGSVNTYKNMSYFRIDF